MSRNERGAVAIVVAISLVGICVVAAFVIDLGLIRVDRQVDKSALDAAALAGANGLISDLGDPTFHPFAGVCQAYRYLKVSDKTFADATSPTWTNGNGDAIAGIPDGCDPSHQNDTCTKDSPASWVRAQLSSNDGKFSVTIQSGYKILQSAGAWDATYGNFRDVTGGFFPDDELPAYSGDVGDIAQFGGCDQVVVVVTGIRSTSLGTPAARNMGTRVRSVARVRIDPPASPFALLILDQHTCDALANTSNGIIDVTGYKTHPGMIHVDSDGTGTQCGSKPVIEGAKTNGVVAHEAPDNNTPGRISVVATGGNKSDGVPKVYAGPAPGSGPVSAARVTRVVLDRIYRAGVSNAVSLAAPYVNATSAPPGFTTKPCPNNDTWTEAQIFVNCPGGVNKNVSMPNATDVIFTGSVSGDVVSMPSARHVYIKGGTSPAGVSVGTTFEVNNGTAGAGCPTAWDSTKQRAQMFIGVGNLMASGTGKTFRACNTTLILMAGQNDACIPTNSPYYDNGNVCPTSMPVGPGVGLLSLSGGVTIDWTAPDLVDDEVPASNADHYNLEDLAFWGESSGTYTLGGSGSMHLMGVFAAPSADMKFGGTPANTVKNSQYVARTLNTTGNGVLSLTPLPSLPVAPPTVTFALVR